MTCLLKIVLCFCALITVTTQQDILQGLDPVECSKVVTGWYNEIVNTCWKKVGHLDLEFQPICFAPDLPLVPVGMQSVDCTVKGMMNDPHLTDIADGLRMPQLDSNNLIGECIEFGRQILDGMKEICKGN